MPRPKPVRRDRRARLHACFRAGLLACLVLVGASPAGAQASAAPVRAPDVAHLLEDRDGDLVPDRTGGVFEVRAVAVMQRRSARTVGTTRWYYTTVQDSTGGLRLLATDPALLEDVLPGASLVARGRLTHRRGVEELVLDDLEVLGPTPPPEPMDVLVRDVLGEALQHRLVRLEGTLRNFAPELQAVVLDDRTGAVPVRIPSRLMMDPELAEKVYAGGRATVVGVVGQSDLTPQFDEGYRVAPRGPWDVTWKPEPPLLEAAVALLLVTLAAGLGSFAYQRQGAVRRSRELERLTGSLERSRRSLQESAAEFERLFDDDVVARFVLDEGHGLARWNPSLEVFLGQGGEGIRGRTLRELGLDCGHPDAQPGSLPMGQIEVRLTAPDGAERIGLMTRSLPEGDGAGVRGSIVDVTERKELEARLANSQKLDALGRLAGGVAHDINNMLATILGNAELVEDEGPFDPFVQESLEEIRTAAARSARLTRQLLTVARRDVVNPEPLSLDAIAQEMAPMLQRVLGKDIELAVVLPGDAPPVMADLSQMEQLLLNLATNAREAMPSGGRLLVETGCEPGENGAPTTVVLRVADDGVGMDDATQARLFEPFFTTKPGGTGLGLATVWGIVKESGGTVACTSAPGEGATFELRFPATDEAPGRSQGRSRRDGGRRLPFTVLVAEDEASVRAMAVRVLERAGCRVVQAQNGEEAARIFSADPGRFDVVLTDMVMPILSGSELAERVTHLRPEIPIVFMSGYVDHAEARRHVSRSRPFVQKPFRPDELVDALDEAVRSGPGSVVPSDPVGV